MGPEVVTFNFETDIISWYNSYFSALPVGTLDGISTHPYNTAHGDWTMVEACWENFHSILAAHGFDGLPIWNTEAGDQYSTHYGSVSWRQQIRWAAVSVLAGEKYNNPKSGWHCSSTCQRATEHLRTTFPLTAGEVAIPIAFCVGSPSVWSGVRTTQD